MGRALVESCLDRGQVALAAGTVRDGSALVGQDLGLLIGRPCLSVAATVEYPVATSEQPLVLIDFTTPAASLDHLQWCVQQSIPCVLGTTGFDSEQLARLAEAAQRIPIVFAPNFSIGVNVVLDLLDRAARAFGEDVDIEIIEAHHRHKVDAPSGTALAMGRTVASALQRDLEAVALYGREGQVGPRPRQQIGFSTIRGGDIIGDHTVLFAGDGERVEITHKASHRRTFADGAVRAATWVVARAPGLYGMPDVLGLSHRSDLS